MGRLLERMAWEVAGWLHIPEVVALGYPASRLVERYEWVIEAQWGRTTEQIAAVEVGVMRALARAFRSQGKGELPELPGYDEMLEAQRLSALSKERRLPTWMEEFERVNVDRCQRMDS